MRRFLEWYLGLPVAEAGQGTRWRLQLAAPLLRTAPETWLLIVTGGAVAMLLYWAGAARVARSRRLWLAGIRLGVLLVLAVCAMRLSLAVNRVRLPWLALLIDRSLSMARSDIEPFSEAGSRRSRLEWIKDWLGREDASPLTELSRTYRLRLFEFADETRDLRTDVTEHVDATRESIRGLRADGRQTRLASALRSVLDEFRGAPPAAIVVLSDGVSSRGKAERLSAAAPQALAETVPVWTVAVGSESTAPDLEVAEVLVDHVALLGDTITFDVRLAERGLGAKPIEVRLTSSQGEALDSATVRAGADGAASATLHHQPAEEGRWDYTIEAIPAAEEVDLQNNARTASVQVRSRQLKVLYVERLPRWEFRHLKAALERDEAIDLKTVLFDSDVEYTQEDRTAIAQPPATAADLATYDAVILGDVDPASLPAAFPELLRDFVGRDGGGLIFIAGSRFNPRSYQTAALAALLPIQPDAGSSGGGSLVPGRIPQITTDGRAQPLLRMESDSGQPVSLPALNWTAGPQSLKSGAMVLAEVPRQGGPPMPILVEQRYGAGRVLWQGTDELWKWRRLREDALYGRYWSQGIRYVSRARLAGAAWAGQLRTDRRVYAPGDPIHVELRSVAERPIAAEPPRIAIESATGDQTSLQLSPAGSAPGQFAGVLTGLGAGTYRARWANLPDNENVDWEFRVDAEAAEMPGAGVDRDDLAEASRLTHGRALDWNDIDHLRSELPAGRPVVTAQATVVPLWDRWEVGLLLAALFCLEWFVRRRNRLV